MSAMYKIWYDFRERDCFPTNSNHFWNFPLLPQSHMFFRASQFNHGGIAKWDVQNVENMKSMFEGAIQFNQDIGDWNVANVKSMAYMFQDAIHFRQNLCDWKSRMKHATTSTCTKMFSGTNCSHRSTVHCVKEVGGFCESC
mmetsp:Transcript_2801/g.6277  ORF Transcript_2801/g.6277 Transcript_2801/m.6277 type:complete len:141 (+) Transcript_2801:778-1200(+)